MDAAFNADLPKNAANYAPLTPLQFTERTAKVFPNRVAWVQEGYHGQPTRRGTWGELWTQSKRFASALQAHGIKRGDAVAVLLPNTAPMLMAHYGVGLVGGVLLSLNTRLDSKTLAFILNHSQAKMVITDTEFSSRLGPALPMLVHTERSKFLVVNVEDNYRESPDMGIVLPSSDGMVTLFPHFMSRGSPDFTPVPMRDEWDAIGLNYTSGTTSDPKGVVIHHRGAYLNTVSNAVVWGMQKHSVYMWTLPMFHCNGWCFPWTVALLAGTHVCLRKVEAGAIYRAIAEHKVTHMCGAPIIMQTMIEGIGLARHKHRVEFMTAASAPPAPILAEMSTVNFNVTHVYGLTETYGPAVSCEWKSEWDELDIPQQATLKARQGVRYPALEGLMVADPETNKPVPADGTTMGEVMFRGGIVMKGYLKNPKANSKTFDGGWFRSGDLAVLTPDGYIQLKDRSKDIIISGGENISSLEVETTLYKHQDVQDAAVVAVKHHKYGETPCAFVTVKNGVTKGEGELQGAIRKFCLDNLPRFSAPKHVVILPMDQMPKTSTGKIQKNVLRELANKTIGVSKM